MTIAFELDGQPYTALNGGPYFKFTEAISFQVNCQTQEEVDYYWEKLSQGGDEKAQQCGWVKDKFRAILADRPNRVAGNVARRGWRENKPGLGSFADDEKA